MTKAKEAAMMKRLGRMVWSEMCMGKDYDLPERFSYDLIDLGYIKLETWTEKFGDASVSYGKYVTTSRGRHRFFEWDAEEENDKKN